MIDRNQVHAGMVVRGSDGKRLGRVLSCTEGGFVVEKRLFSATDYAARYDEVAEVSVDTIQLSRPRQDFFRAERQSSMGDQHGVVWPSYGDEGGGGLL